VSHELMKIWNLWSRARFPIFASMGLRSTPHRPPSPEPLADSAPGWPGPSPMTPTEWLVCVVAGLGFAFDLYETLMTALIVGPALTSLGRLAPGTPGFNLWGWERA